MTAFVSFATLIQSLLAEIVSCPALHAKWLNTLSYLENCGARKIAACQHPTLVKEEILKHAAEEFRHAHYLKHQIRKISPKPLKTYSLSTLLGGTASLHYLRRLDLMASRYLYNEGLSSDQLKAAAYLLVTYAIERRAEELYPIYDDVLRKTGSLVFVKSIVLEEKEHLNEMKEGIQWLPSGWRHAEHLCAIESHLCQTWLMAISTQLDMKINFLMI